MPRMSDQDLRFEWMGFALGFLILVAAGAIYVAAKAIALTQERSHLPTPSVTASPWSTQRTFEQASPRPPQTAAGPSDTPMPAIEATAEAKLTEGDPAGALALLAPLLGEPASGDELARINKDLARAEFLLGHFQRAAGYFEAAFALDPDPAILLDLATAYDLGGDLHSALAKYLRLASWEGAQEDLRQMARDRAREIVNVIGTPTAGP